MRQFQLFEFFSINRVVSTEIRSDQEQSLQLKEQHYGHYLHLLAADLAEDFELSQQSRKGKFIQVVLQNHELLIFMPFWEHHFWYHAAILKELLLRLHISGGFPSAYAHTHNYEYCGYDRNSVDVVGGGFYALDAEQLSLKLSGKSTAYGPYNQTGIMHNFESYRHCFSDYQLFLL